jgi:hypothetical protein
MTDNITQFPKNGDDRPQFPEDEGQLIADQYQELVETIKEFSSKITEMSARLGVPEVTQATALSFRRGLDHIDIGVNFLLHRALTQEIPAFWAQHQIEERMAKEAEESNDAKSETDETVS